MAVNKIIGGAHPVDGQKFAPRRYTVASGYAPANACVGIAPGEFVKLVTAGSLQIADAGDAALLLGVVASVSYIDSSGTRITGGYLPSGYTYTGDNSIRNKNAPIIMVWDQPSMEYLMRSAGAATTNALIGAGTGANMDLSATSSTTVDTVYKRSLRTLDGTFVAGTAQMRVLEQLRDPWMDMTTVNPVFRVMINEGFHAFFSGAGI